MMITLTDTDQHPFLVNSDNILYVETITRGTYIGKCFVHLVGGKELLVLEDLSTVELKIYRGVKC